MTRVEPRKKSTRRPSTLRLLRMIEGFVEIDQWSVQSQCEQARVPQVILAGRSQTGYEFMSISFGESTGLRYLDYKQRWTRMVFMYLTDWDGPTWWTTGRIQSRLVTQHLDWYLLQIISGRSRQRTWLHLFQGSISWLWTIISRWLPQRDISWSWILDTRPRSGLPFEWPHV